MALTIPGLARAAVLAGVLLPAGSLAAQQAAGPPSVRARFPGDTLVLRQYPEFEPGGLLGPRVPPALVALRWRQQVDRAIEEARRRRLREGAFGSTLAVRDTLGAGVPVVPAAPAVPAPSTFAALGRYADVGLELRSRLELKLDRLKNEHCTSFDISSLTPAVAAVFPRPPLDSSSPCGPEGS